jgi:hypothetical protein
MQENISKRDKMFFLILHLVFFSTKEPFKIDDVQQKQILEDLILLIVKNHLPLQFVESN